MKKSPLFYEVLIITEYDWTVLSKNIYFFTITNIWHYFDYDMYLACNNHQQYWRLFIFLRCLFIKANKQISTTCFCRKAKWLLKTLTILSYLLCVCKDQISKAQEQTYCVVRKSRRPAPFWMTQCHRNASKYFVVHHGSKNPYEI